MEIQNKIREGNFETFYTVLEEASKKASSSNFILNDLMEVFIYLTFLFDNVNEIFIFSEDFNNKISPIQDDYIEKYCYIAAIRRQGHPIV